MLQRKTSVVAGLKAASSVCTWLAVVALLAACGQKGPLALPKPATASAAVAAPAASAASAR